MRTPAPLAGARALRISIALLLAVLVAVPRPADSKKRSLAVSWNRAFFGLGDTGKFHLDGKPGWMVWVATDVEPGPTLLPGIGPIQVGVSPLFFMRRWGVIPPNGKLDATCNLTCGSAILGQPLYAQAVALDPVDGSVRISDPVVTMFFDDDGRCGLGDEGCSASYWALPMHHGMWPAPYRPTTDFDAVFGPTDPGLTLIDALEARGGIDTKLRKESVAALLNAASAGVDFPMTPDQVVMLYMLAAPDPPARPRLVHVLEDYNRATCSP